MAYKLSLSWTSNGGNKNPRATPNWKTKHAWYYIVHIFIMLINHYDVPKRTFTVYNTKMVQLKLRTTSCILYYTVHSGVFEEATAPPWFEELLVFMEKKHKQD